MIGWAPTCIKRNTLISLTNTYSGSNEKIVTVIFSATGHFGNLGSGAGAVELVASILALQKGMVPPTRNCIQVDPLCPINVVREQPQISSVPSFIKLSHANTGRSFALILEKY